MSAFIVYHNPNCSTSRKVVKKLRMTGKAVEIVRYLETPPNIAALQAIVAKTGKPVRALLRSKESLYAEFGLEEPSLNDKILYQAMATHPILIKRPIVVKGARAVLGRPADLVDTLI